MCFTKIVRSYFVLPIFFYYIVANILLIALTFQLFILSGEGKYSAKADSDELMDINLSAKKHQAEIHFSLQDFEQSYMFQNDQRAVMLDEYFASINSPLNGVGHVFIEEAEKYGFDWKFLPSLAMQESSGAKSMTANEHKNPFGWGFNDDKNKNNESVYNMPSFEESIRTVAFWINNSYIQQGLETPEEIVTKYNPGSVQRAGGMPENSEWVRGIRFFYDKFESFES